MSKFMSRKGRKGFTLVELAVVIVIIGVLASFGVPKFMQSVERSKASEAFNFLSAVRSAQERYQAKEGTYTTDWTLLDIAWKNDGSKPVLQYFA
ncbi:MAG: prepilin-type N-terminal cleavage/methylation domain-containing protein, partial [Isosphaeraceae bacterium]